MNCPYASLDMQNFRDYPEFLQACNQIFLEIMSSAQFNGKPIQYSRHNKNGVNATFWHCVAGGKDAPSGTDSSRAEKIIFLNVVSNCDSECNQIKTTVSLHNPPRLEVVCKKRKYMVVLEDRKSHYMLITAYPMYRRTQQKHKRKK